ncbi:MAG: DUF4197 domain-containing protein [Candidatus Scalindua sp. AMX11]|nr:MAG: DUF4197 domain-containing protein [Candidatus Scalindua sp.]NOG84053.1 DUF4197 domain-containing protein [Planctomycetota bacterium]RZV67444.1 MAG: DUF4197 domain-containing protein [Candidatus Scalindua sp. SCAELEC01]TDE63674.1 MAG: DUF4197 domain-containing protein [Candidatus Scalindua sp. AMX11]GJQ60567.1 MAG: hypothetical protein SCALA701_33680 [Candidatus Scalindua sp.]
MKKSIILVIMVVQIFVIYPCYGGIFDKILKTLGGSAQTTSNADSIVSALKEAIAIGTNNAVSSVSKVDGFFGNQSIKIPLPKKVEMLADGLKKIGYEKKVDDFVLSMNRAAEKAAPEAKSFFLDAVKEMSFDDAKGILNGGDTAASDYFKKKTTDQLYEVFKPIISSQMSDVGVTRYYQDMTSKLTSLPFMNLETLDLDHHVTNKALDGLFFMIGEEEKKIRSDPKARVTELLKEVFGGK